MTNHPDDERPDHDLRAQLRELAPSPRFHADRLKLEVERSLRTRALRRRTLRIGAQLAAGLALFAAGAWYGRLASTDDVRADRTITGIAAPVPVVASELPLSIQTTGSSYVASLASLTEMRDQLTPAQREQARQVALSVLAGAMSELAAAGDGRLPPEVLRTVLGLGVPTGGVNDAVMRVR